MSIEIVTKEDLQAFRIQLLNDIKLLLAPKAESQKEWLRSNEIRNILKISPGKLQNLRVTGKLKPCKLGGVFLYSQSDLEKLLKNNL
jgi:hypothetical protein